MIDAAKSKVLYRKTSGTMPLISHASEFSLFDQIGREYKDMSGGACFASLGYSARVVQTAVQRQIAEVPYAFSGYWATRASEQAGELLAAEFERANPGWFGKVIFQQGGGEAVDLACKLAAQYHVEGRRDYERTRIVSREHSYHGVSLLPFSLSGYYPRYDKIYDYQHDVWNDYTHRIEHPYNCKVVLPKFEEDISAVIVEPVTGPTLGCWVESVAYMRELRNACANAGALLIYDEILCGSGRCGYISTAEHYGVWPDIILLGKGLAAGYQPVSAIVMSKKVLDRIAQGSGYAMFGTCYSAHSTGCAAVAATLRFLREQLIYETVQFNGPQIYNLIVDEIRNRTTVVKAHRGLGHLWGLEFQDPETNEPFDPDQQFHLQVREAVMRERTVVYSKGQTVNGYGDFMTIAPALNMPLPEISLGLRSIAHGIHHAYQAYKERASVSTIRD